MALFDAAQARTLKLKQKINQALGQQDVNAAQDVLDAQAAQEQRNAEILAKIDETLQKLVGIKPPDLPATVAMPSRGHLAAAAIQGLVGGDMNAGINQAMQIAQQEEKRKYDMALQGQQQEAKVLGAQATGYQNMYEAGLRNEQQLGIRYDRMLRDDQNQDAKMQTALGVAMNRYQQANTPGEKESAAIEANRIAETMGVGQVYTPGQVQQDLVVLAQQKRNADVKAASEFNDYVEGIRRANGQLTDADLERLAPMREELIRQGVPEAMLPDPSKEVTLAKQRLDQQTKQFQQTFGLRKETEARRAAEAAERLRISRENLALARERAQATNLDRDWDRVLQLRRQEEAGKQELRQILQTELGSIESDLKAERDTLKRYESELAAAFGNDKIAAQAKVDAQRKVVSGIVSRKTAITDKIKDLRETAESQVQKQAIQGGGEFTAKILAFASDTSRGKDVDCSQFTQNFFKSSGISLPRTAIAQYRHIQKKNAFVKQSDVSPGDLVFFDNGSRTAFNTNGKAIAKGVYANHVGIVSRVVGGQIFVVDDSSGRAPKERPLSQKYRVLGFGRPV